MREQEVGSMNESRWTSAAEEGSNTDQIESNSDQTEMDKRLIIVVSGWSVHVLLSVP